jgi:hypothetical protein
MSQTSFHDAELLNAYLDGQLNATQHEEIESRLARDDELKELFDALRESKAVLRRLPHRRAPRNFMLSPKMAGIKPPLPRAYPVLRFASAFAGFLFLFAYAANYLPRFALPLGAAAPAMEMQTGIGGGAPQDNTRNQSGGGCDTCTAEATPQALAPLAPSAKVAPTEIPAATLGPEGQPAPENFSQTTASQERRPIPALTPLQTIILGVAILAGLAALAIRLRTERAFTRKNKAG